MRSILFAAATAGLLASSGVVADTTSRHRTGTDSEAFVSVQYRYDRWDDRAASINEREARLNARIQRGLNEGSITNREARRLYAQLRDVQAKERAFRSDGRLDNREANALNRDLDRLAFNFRGERRDYDRRY